ncbi:glycoside hydrolase family 88 protein [Alkalicoccus daliensis]|uniref:Unsaturated chondroitin disaccharide hydrolase n=1 Tax=Alkalicoccus daliensis TaxID=745820 RepID=A0A1H0GA58_9BACI|nr:glycoside hydrolase family 88 protein [Alkalicoccus daliensis]SDO03731.1 unsaturated chondroitin disaccharide hydrolase [Alkalicoccus daliensis]
MDTAWVDQAWEDITKKLEQTSRKIGANFPHASENGSYKQEPPYWWTAGFWPGQLWLLYNDTKDESVKEIAVECENRIHKEIENIEKLDHDIGFMWSLTSVARYKLLGESDARTRGILAANLLLGRFNAQGEYIRAWNPWFEGDENRGYAIIDCTMNLSLLFWASEETEDPRFKHAAVKHADTVLKHFLEEDGSVHHIVNFDPETGERVEYIGGQGYAAHSAWSRGTAWAVYGLALCFDYTGDTAYLEAAKKVAHFFIVNLNDDHIPAWDFRIPADVEAYTDSSAGAIAAAGLLLLSEKVSEHEKEIYHRNGLNILKSLYENYSSFHDEEEEGIILHGTSHYPEQKFLNNPLIYGDYFFVESIAKLKGNFVRFW